MRIALLLMSPAGQVIADIVCIMLVATFIGTFIAIVRSSRKTSSG